MCVLKGLIYSNAAFYKSCLVFHYKCLHVFFQRYTNPFGNISTYMHPQTVLTTLKFGTSKKKK